MFNKKLLQKLFKTPNFYIPAILFIVVLASRLFLLNGSIDFFDSTQYIWRSELPTLKEALSTGHAPFHPGYIFFTWITFQIFKLFGSSNIALVAAVPSAIFGSLTILFFYLLVKKIFDGKIALLSAVLVAITPFFWISNLAIIVDPTMICFYILSLYLFYLWLDKQNYWYLIISGFALGLSMWAHTQIAFWCLGFVALFIYKVKFKDWFSMIIKSIPFVIGPFFFIGIYLYLLVSASHNPTYVSALKYLFGGNAGDHMLYSLLPGSRNYAIIMTTLVAGFSVLGVIKMIIDKKYKEFWLIVIWLFPGLFLSALYLYANLYGRSSMIAIFPGMIAVSYFLLSWKAKNIFTKIIQIGLITLVICQLLVVSLPIIKLYVTQPSALEESAILQKNIKQEGLYLTSNQAKTIYCYIGNSDVIWEMPKEKIKRDINNALDNNKPIYIGQDAIMFPYFKYDGNNWEIKSTNLEGPLEHQSIANYLFSQFNFNLVESSNLKNKIGIYELNTEDISLTNRLKNSIDDLHKNQSIVLGRLIDENLFLPVARNQIDIYSKKSKYIVSPERINYQDWIFNIYNYLVYKNDPVLKYKEPLLFNYSDKSGYFAMNLPEDQTDNIKLVTSSFDLSTNDIFSDISIPIQFSKKKYKTINSDSEETDVVNSPEQLAEKINSDKSFYAIINKVDNKIYYKLYYFSYHIDLYNEIGSLSLASNSDIIVNDDDAESDIIRKIDEGVGGYLVFGPWIKLNKGKYKLTFRLKIEDFEKDDNIGYIEVSAEDFPHAIAKRELKVEDFNFDDKYVDINLDLIAYDDLESVEFRIKSNQATSIFLDNIKIFQE